VQPLSAWRVTRQLHALRLAQTGGAGCPCGYNQAPILERAELLTIAGKAAKTSSAVSRSYPHFRDAVVLKRTCSVSRFIAEHDRHHRDITSGKELHSMRTGLTWQASQRPRAH